MKDPSLHADGEARKIINLLDKLESSMKVIHFFIKIIDIVQKPHTKGKESRRLDYPTSVVMPNISKEFHSSTVHRGTSLAF